MTQYRFKATCPCGSTTEQELQTETQWKLLVESWNREHRKHWTPKRIAAAETPKTP